MKPTILSSFDTMTQNVRGNSGWALLHHVIKEPYKLHSRNGLTDKTLATADISNFVHGYWNDGGTLSRVMYGLGKIGGDTSSIQIYKYNDTTEGWDTLANADSTSGSLDYSKFFYFEGFLYGYRSNAVIWKFGDTRDTGANAFTDNWETGSWTHSTQPVIVGANAYFAMDNKVYELSTGSTALALRFTLSPDRYITSLSPKGSALSVMTYNESEDRSREFLFSLGDTEITNAYDSIDWGSGKVVHHAEINSIICAVQNERINQAGDISDGAIKLKRSSGGVPVVDHEIRTEVLGSIGEFKKTFEDSLLFAVTYTQDGEEITGIAAFSSNGEHYFPFTTEFNTASLRGFEIHGNQWFVAHSSGSVIRTGGTTKYKSTAVTRKIDNGDFLSTKKVQGVSVYFSPMTSSATDYVKLYYRDEDMTDWLQIGEMLGSADNEDKTRLSCTKETVSGDTLRQYKERQYKIEFIGVDFLGLRTSTPKIIKDEPYDI